MTLTMASAFPVVLGIASAGASSAFAQTAESSGSSTGSSHAPVKELGVVTISGGQPTSLPTQIPTTIEGETSEQIEHAINATDS